MPRDEVEARLTERIHIGKEIEAREITSEVGYEDARAAYYTWDEFNLTLLRKAFSTSRPADEYRSLGFGGGTVDASIYQMAEYLREDVRRQIRRLESLKDQLELYEIASGPAPAKVVAPQGTDVFVVHGHATWAKESAARFISAVTGDAPTILHEQPNEGRTIIEKFEEYGQRAGFAIILLTGDDKGAPKDAAELNSRARQNVVFELGFFVGALGRQRVAVLHEDGVELPSDISGVLYTRLDDSDAWKLELAREMKAAGISVDLNQVL